MEIVKINHQHLADSNKANQPFEVIGKIKPTFSEGIWTYTEEIYEQSYTKVYADEPRDYAVYIDNSDKTGFFAYSDKECVGQIVLKRDWNGYAFIEDLCVAKSARGQGVGTALIICWHAGSMRNAVL